MVWSLSSRTGDLRDQEGWLVLSTLAFVAATSHSSGLGNSRERISCRHCAYGNAIRAAVTRDRDGVRHPLDSRGNALSDQP